MANHTQRNSSLCTRDELEEENSELKQQLTYWKKNCSTLLLQLSTANINLKKNEEKEAAFINQAKENSEEIAKWKKLYARAQAQTDLDCVNEKLAKALVNYNKLEKEHTQVKAELHENCAKIRKLEETLKHEAEKWEVTISTLKYTHKIQIDNYEETIFKNDVELKELRNLVRKCENIAKKEDTKVLVFQKSKDDVDTESQHNVIDKQKDYIKSLEGFLSIFGEATDENYVLQKEMESKDGQLQEARELILELNNVADKSEKERLKEKQIYEREKAKMENDVEEVKAVLVEKEEQLKTNDREREQFLGFLDTVKDMVQFSGDDNFPLLNQLDGLKTCLNEKLKVLLDFCKVVDKVEKLPTTTITTTTIKSPLKTVKQPTPKKKRLFRLHAEDLSKRVSGRGPENLGGKYYCLCKFKAPSKEVLQYHIQHVSQEHKFKCDKCPKRFLLMTTLEQHLKSVHGIQFEGVGGCHSCGILFKSREEKASHGKCPNNSAINQNHEHCMTLEFPMKTEVSNSTDDELSCSRVVAPPTPPTSTVGNRNDNSDENKKSSRQSEGTSGEKEQSRMKKLKLSHVQNSSSPPPPKRRRVSTDSDEEDEVDIETFDLTD